jgi:hypothetical protein
MDPNFTYLHLQAAAAPGVLAQARQLTVEVGDLDWDEHSIWGSLGQIDAGSLMLHHGFRPLAGECPCQNDGRGLCVHIAAVALAYLGDGDELKDALTALPHTDLVTLLCDVTECSEQARQMIRHRALG